MSQNGLRIRSSPLLRDGIGLSEMPLAPDEQAIVTRRSNRPADMKAITEYWVFVGSPLLEEFIAELDRRHGARQFIIRFSKHFLVSRWK